MLLALTLASLVPLRSGDRVLASATYSATVLADAPVSYWRVGETSGTVAADSGAGGNNGAYTGGYTQGVPGAITGDTDTAVAFDGKTGYVTVPDNANLDITGDITIEAWAKPASLSGATGTVLQKGNSSSSGGPGWQYRVSVTSANRWKGILYVGSANYEIVDTVDALSVSRWDYLVLERSGSTLTFYVNGVSVGSLAISGATNVTTGALAFGRAGSYAKYYFNGRVDEVAIYNKALSLTQIQNHLTAATSATPTPTVAPTGSPTPTGTATPAPTATATPGPTATATPGPSPTATSTPAPAPTATSTPLPTPTATVAPAPTATSTPTPGGGDPILMAAGDIACDPGDSAFNGGAGTSSACQARYTAALLSGANVVAPIGDEQYDCAPLSSFQASYALSWGQWLSVTHPSVGNHEYKTTCGNAAAGAAGYYTYLAGVASPLDPGCLSGCRGYYSYDVGSWHVIVLNSECAQVGGCQAGSAQEQWLQADLAAHPAACTLAYWHRPFYTSGWSLGDAELHDIWSDLYAGHVDLVLNGHDHDYERFLPQDANGNANAMGVTEIVVGTGGQSHGGFNGTVANSVVRDATTFGVLKLTLHAGSWDWQFVGDGQSGSFTDSGSAACH